jgi:hypothetical protein
MPFASDKQRRFLFAKKPEVAREFAEKEKQHEALARAKKRSKRRG